MRTTLGFALAVLLAAGFAWSLGAGNPALAQEDVQKAAQFPEEHKDFLGGSSYRAYFGVDLSTYRPTPPAGALTGPPPQVGDNTQVNAPQFPFPDGLLGRSETTIASDTSNRTLVVGWNDADGFCGPPFNAGCTPAVPTGPGGSGFGFSTDGGASWTDGGAPFPVTTPGGTKITRGDPVLDSGGPGHNTFYYANLAVDITSTSPGLGGFVVHRGAFGQGLFTFDNAVFVASPNAPNDFLDKEWLCAGKTGPYKDRVAVSVSNFIEVQGIPFFGFGQIEVYPSGDRASSFGPRTIVQPDETISVPQNLGIVNQGSNCAYGPDGELYVVWERGWLYPFFGGFQTPQIVVATSFDNGASFGPRTLVSDISSAAVFPPGGYNRNTTNDFPRICVAGKDDDPYRGRVYVVYQSSEIANGGTQAQTGGLGHYDTDVYLRYSDDAGATWSAPTLVAGGGDELLQFWPAVECNQSDGDVDVVWYQSEETETPDFLDSNGTGESLVDVFHARSTDGGASFSAPLRVTTFTTPWRATVSNISPNFGDYIDLFVNSNRVHVTWADGRNGVPDVFYSTIKTK
ncbi:MAG: sialidase family protein [Acidobacteriota bacterium]|jgi:hypothetical protein